MLNNFLLGFGAGKAQGGGSTPCPEPTGTKEINLTANGTTTHDVAGYADAEVTVNVPTKDYVTNDWVDKTKPVGAINSDISDTPASLYGRTEITSIRLPNATKLPTYFAYECSDCKLLFAPKASSSSNILYHSGVETLVIGKSDNYISSVWNTASHLKVADVSGSYIGTQRTFDGDSVLETIILRNSTVVALGNTNSFTGTPFASNGTGGTLYVPSALIASYQSASNWSTILGYPNNQIKAIEGSIYETKYADGTPIPAA